MFLLRANPASHSHHRLLDVLDSAWVVTAFPTGSLGAECGRARHLPGDGAAGYGEASRVLLLRLHELHDRHLCLHGLEGLHIEHRHGAYQADLLADAEGGRVQGGADQVDGGVRGQNQHQPRGRLLDLDSNRRLCFLSHERRGLHSLEELREAPGTTHAVDRRRGEWSLVAAMS